MQRTKRNETRKKNGCKRRLKQQRDAPAQTSDRTSQDIDVAQRAEAKNTLINCLTCPSCGSLKGSDKQECTEHRWTFSKELAEQQALCDTHVNTSYPTVTEDVPDTQ